MPTYDYECDACGHTYELFQSIKASPVRKCPRCGKSKARRLIGTGAGVIFKGSGFYQTDYRSESYKKAAASDSGSSSSSSAGSGSTSTAKTESQASTPAKSESKPTGKSKGGK